MSVLCAEDGEWYDGRVAGWRTKPISQDNATILVDYDDGDLVWHKLFGEIFNAHESAPSIRWHCPSLRQHDALVVPQVLPIHEALAMHDINDVDSRPFLDSDVVPLLLEHHNASTEASLYWRLDEANADGDNPRSRMWEGLAALAERLGHDDLLSSSILSMEPPLPPPGVDRSAVTHPGNMAQSG